LFYTLREYYILMKYVLWVFFIACIINVFKALSPEAEPLNFVEARASDTTEKERISICHSSLGSVSSTFTYQVKGDEVWSLHNNKPDKYCKFWGKSVVLGELKTVDKNKCHTLTKAEVKRGGRVTSVEYNPKYSVYKDGNIYWSCQKGRSPNRVDERVYNRSEKIYRFADDYNVLLLPTYYSNVYFYKGVIFRSIGDRGEANVYNSNTIILDETARFNRTVNLLPESSITSG